jgi:hypothetical protein
MKTIKIEISTYICKKILIWIISIFSAINTALILVQLTSDVILQIYNYIIFVFLILTITGTMILYDIILEEK